MSAKDKGFTIRPFTCAEDFAASQELQKLVWGERYIGELTPAVMWLVCQIGGVMVGAFDNTGSLAGMVLGISGVQERHLVHWSHMLAVRPESRNSALGIRLKLFQRDSLLSIGIDRVLGTFDPFNVTYAHLLLCRLGAISRSYVRDQYPGSKSPLHRNIGTDRLVSEWLLSTPRVETRISKRWPYDPLPSEVVPEVNSVSRTNVIILSNPPNFGVEGPMVGINVPSAIADVQKDVSIGMDWRMKTRAAFEEYFARGYRAMELRRNGDVCTYILVLGEDCGVAICSRSQVTVDERPARINRVFDG